MTKPQEVPRHQKVPCPICGKMVFVGEGLTNHIKMRHKRLTKKLMQEEAAKTQVRAMRGKVIPIRYVAITTKGRFINPWR
jgi:hypothetical protein